MRVFIFQQHNLNFQLFSWTFFNQGKTPKKATKRKDSIALSKEVVSDSENSDAEITDFGNGLHDGNESIDEGK